MGLYIGLMSGTSADAVDAALVDIAPKGTVSLVAGHTEAMPRDVRRQVLSLFADEPMRPRDLAKLDTRIGRLFARTARNAIRLAGVRPASVTAVGSHGQTVHHTPGGRYPATLQLGDASIIAEMTGITTVGDFRRRDIAAGGQGAPLAPAFHAHVLGSSTEARVVLNLGGIANITALPGGCTRDQPITGFDTGPGNGLLDAWASRELGQPMDANGAWSRSGTLDQTLLKGLLQESYFGLVPPKSTGRELFGIDWLLTRLARLRRPVQGADVANTLCELTAVTVSRAVQRWVKRADAVLVCGGGVHNAYLMERLTARLAPVPVASTSCAGVPAEWMECMAFAWLAQRRLAGLSGNVPSVTGARREVVLGSVHAARLRRIPASPTGA